MMEYLLLGIPAIAADWPTMRRYFGDDAVTYVPPNDVAALASAIERLLYRDSGLRSRQAAVARQQYLDSIAWSRTKHRYLSVYDLESPLEDQAAGPHDGEPASKTLPGGKAGSSSCCATRAGFAMPPPACPQSRAASG